MAESQQSNPAALAKGTSPFGRTVGWFGAIVGIGPSLYAFGVSSIFFVNLVIANPRAGSIRPMGAAVLAVELVVLNLCICSPVALVCAWFAGRWGAKKESALAIGAAKSFLMPLVIIFWMVTLASVVAGVRLSS